MSEETPMTGDLGNAFEKLKDFMAPEIKAGIRETEEEWTKRVEMIIETREGKKVSIDAHNLYKLGKSPYAAYKIYQQEGKI